MSTMLANCIWKVNKGILLYAFRGSNMFFQVSWEGLGFLLMQEWSTLNKEKKNSAVLLIMITWSLRKEFKKTKLSHKFHTIAYLHFLSNIPFTVSFLSCFHRHISCHGSGLYWSNNRPKVSRLIEEKAGESRTNAKGSAMRRGLLGAYLPSKRKFNNPYVQTFVGVLSSESRV